MSPAGHDNVQTMAEVIEWKKTVDIPRTYENVLAGASACTERATDILNDFNSGHYVCELEKDRHPC